MSKNSKALKGYLDRLKVLFQDIGKPVYPTDAEAKNEIGNYINQVDTLLTVCDFKMGNIPYANGFSHWLGLSDSMIRTSDLIQHVLPNHQLLYMAKSLAIFKTLQKFKGFVRINGAFAYEIFFPVQMKDGNCFHIKQLSMPLHLDENQQMVQQLNIYRIIEPFRGQAATSNFLSFQGGNLALNAMKETYKQHLLQEINDKKSPFYRRKFLPFSPRQFEIMTKMIKNPIWKIGQISAEMGVLPETGKDYSKDVLRLAKIAFPTVALHQTRSVAAHLFNMDVI